MVKKKNTKKKKNRMEDQKTDKKQKSKSVLLFLNMDTVDKMTELSKATNIKKPQMVTDAVNEHIRKHPKKPVSSLRECIEEYIEDKDVDSILLAQDEAELAKLQSQVEERRARLKK